jgi:hypothetical protein
MLTQLYKDYWVIWGCYSSVWYGVKCFYGILRNVTLLIRWCESYMGTCLLNKLSFLFVGHNTSCILHGPRRMSHNWCVLDLNFSQSSILRACSELSVICVQLQRVNCEVLQLQSPLPPNIATSVDYRDLNEDRRARLREIELKAVQYQDELECGQRTLKGGWSIQQQVEHYRRKLLRKVSCVNFNPLSTANTNVHEIWCTLEVHDLFHSADSC